MEASNTFVCNYVGKTPLAKGYGVYPLYRLSKLPVIASPPPRRRATSAPRSEASPVSAR